MLGIYGKCRMRTVWSRESGILAEALALARREAGLDQAEVAARMGNDQTVISKIERGQRRIDVVEFRDYAIAINRDPVDLYKCIVDRWNQSDE
jgi:transcriptional regulator with XRE-family HTH domain